MQQSISGSLSSAVQKYVLTAFGTEGVNYEVSHAEVLQRISELLRKNKYYGVCSLLPQDQIAKMFVECINFVYSNIPSIHYSNIIGSILSSIKGDFGETKINKKSEHSPIWISPFTSMYWFMDLIAVAKQKLFYNDVLDSKSVKEVADAIEKYRRNKKAGKPIIPI
jgi:hypothetical protein